MMLTGVLSVKGMAFQTLTNVYLTHSSEELSQFMWSICNVHIPSVVSQ